MDEASFKKLLDEAIAPIKEDLTEVKSTQTKLQGGVEQLHNTVSKLQDNFNELQGTVNEMKNTLDNRVLPSVIETETTVKSYADSYKINKGNIEKLDDRLTAVEDQLEIQPSDQLAIQR